MTSHLSKAKYGVVNDEFYTRREDIDDGLADYRDYFRGKSIYCNCDDYSKSEFVKYFMDNFEELGIRELTATCYKPKLRSLFDDAEYVPPHGLRMTSPDYIEHFQLSGNGDFRQPECMDILRQADIIVTNPPFSLLRTLTDICFSEGKDFILVAPLHAVGYKNIFWLLAEGKIHYARCEITGTFVSPNGSTIRGPTSFWLTTIDCGYMPDKIELTKEYNPVDYPMFDQFRIINVDKLADIPNDYSGIMGVPITIFGKWNKDQFAILGQAGGDSRNMSTYRNVTVNGEMRFKRIFVINKELQESQSPVEHSKRSLASIIADA